MLEAIPMLGKILGARPRDLAPAPERDTELLQIMGSGRSYNELVAFELSGDLFQQRILHVVKAIALEAAEFGARELFIGHPNECRYEFMVGDTGYQGSMEPGDYSGLLRLFGKESEIEFQVSHFEISGLKLSLTSNHSNSVVHVSWLYAQEQAHDEESSGQEAVYERSYAQ